MDEVFFDRQSATSQVFCNIIQCIIDFVENVYNDFLTGHEKWYKMGQQCDLVTSYRMSCF